MGATHRRQFCRFIDRVQASIDLPWGTQVGVFCRACEGYLWPSNRELGQMRRLAIELLIHGHAAGHPVHAAAYLRRLARAATVSELCTLLDQMRAQECVIESEPDGLRRWSAAVLQILRSPRDIRRVDEWAKLLNVSPHTVRTWCKTTSIPVKQSLDFGRLLRAVHLAVASRSSIARFLNIAHPRTLSRLAAAGGVNLVGSPRLSDVFDRQRFVDDRVAVELLRRQIPEVPLAGSGNCEAHLSGNDSGDVISGSSGRLEQTQSSTRFAPPSSEGKADRHFQAVRHSRSATSPAPSTLRGPARLRRAARG